VTRYGHSRLSIVRLFWGVAGRFFSMAASESQSGCLARSLIARPSLSWMSACIDPRAEWNGAHKELDIRVV